MNVVALTVAAAILLENGQAIGLTWEAAEKISPTIWVLVPEESTEHDVVEARKNVPAGGSEEVS